MQMLLALNGKMGRLIMAQWLQKNGVYAYEASEWNELTHTLQGLFRARYVQSPPTEFSESDNRDTEGISISIVIIVIDIGFLDLSTDIWKEQLSYLDTHCTRAKFAWILHPDTSNTIKAELRRRGHLLMVNRPLYKAKIIQILEAVIKYQDQSLEMRKCTTALKSTVVEGNWSECHEVDDFRSCVVSSDDSDKSEQDDPGFVNRFHGQETRNEHYAKASPFQSGTLNGHFVELTQVDFEENACNTKNSGHTRVEEQHLTCPKEQDTVSTCTFVSEQKSLEGLRILLAEDTPVLQRVASIMLEKLGAKVVAVGDGQQAVDALKFMFHPNELRKESPSEDDNSEIVHYKPLSLLPYDLILMDCQVRDLKTCLIF